MEQGKTDTGNCIKKSINLPDAFLADTQKGIGIDK